MSEWLTGALAELATTQERYRDELDRTGRGRAAVDHTICS